MTCPVAVLDSCVLFPNLLRDTLLSTAEAGLYRAHWSQEILNGVTRNLIARKILTAEKAAYLEEVIKTYFSEAMVEVVPELVSQMTNHERDRHVLAAAVFAEAQVIVTFNLKHFMPQATSRWGIEAQHPDLFLLSLWEENPTQMVKIINEQALRFKRPPLSVLELLAQLEKQVPQFAVRVQNSLKKRPHL